MARLAHASSGQPAPLAEQRCCCRSCAEPSDRALCSMPVCCGLPKSVDEPRAFRPGLKLLLGCVHRDSQRTRVSEALVGALSHAKVSVIWLALSTELCYDQPRCHDASRALRRAPAHPGAIGSHNKRFRKHVIPIHGVRRAKASYWSSGAHRSSDMSSFLPAGGHVLLPQRWISRQCCNNAAECGSLSAHVASWSAVACSHHGGSTRTAGARGAGLCRHQAAARSS